MTVSVEELVAEIEGSKSVTFENENGDPFTLHLLVAAVPLVLMSGSELDMMMDDKDKIAGKFMQIFNPRFLWTRDEMLRLGKALVELVSEDA